MYKSSFIHEFVIDSEWVSVYICLLVCIYMYFQEINCIGQATQMGIRDHNSGVCVKWKCFLIESRFDTIPKWISFDLYLVKGSQHDIRINDVMSYFCTSTNKNVSDCKLPFGISLLHWIERWMLQEAYQFIEVYVWAQLFVRTMCMCPCVTSLVHAMISYTSMINKTYSSFANANQSHPYS